MSDMHIYRTNSRLKKLEDQVKSLEAEIAMQKIESEFSYFNGSKSNDSIWDLLYDFLKSQEKGEK